MKTKEIEIRFPVNARQLDSLRTKFPKLKSAKLLAQKDTYFCHQSYIEKKKTKSAPAIMRLRLIDSHAELAYKSFQKEGSWIELETSVGDAVAMTQILGHLGYGPYLEILKKRLSLVIKGIEINIDQIKGLGTYVELEKKGTDVQKIQNELVQFAETVLGLKTISVVKKGYVQLMEERV